MTKEEELRLALLKLFSKSPFFIATVAEVDESDYSCTVKDFANNEYPGVRLKSSVDARNGFIIVPKINSEVIVSSLKSDSTACFVVVFGEVEKVINTISGTAFTINKDGFVIKRSAESLKKIISNLIDQINTITVPTGTGPSGVPVNATAFSAIKTRLDNLFTE